MAVAFHYSIHFVYEETLVRWSKMGTWQFACGSFLMMSGAALLSGWLVNQKNPAAGGSGIPQLKLAYWKDFGWMSPKIIWVKFVAATLSIGGGMSLGREGPSVQLAGASGSWLATRLKLAKQMHRMPSAAASAAGLAAAFNTPLAAVTFVLEEIVGDLNSRFLGPILVASVVGALVAHGLIGPEPAFRLGALAEPDWEVYALTPVVAVFAALVGVMFQWGTLKLRGRMKIWTAVPPGVRLLCCAVLAWGIGMAVWLGTGHLGVFSLGYEDLSSALAGSLSWKIAALLMVAKLAATILCYGGGGCGGIFSPTLFLGGMAGLAVGGACQFFLPVSGGDIVILSVVGMCACLGAVVRAPVTGILIVFEMTHQFSLLLPLMLGALIAHSLGKRMLHGNFYEAILEQDGNELERIIPPRDLESWQQLPISAIANFSPVSLPSVEKNIIAEAFEKHSYRAFPVIDPEGIKGILRRSEIERAMLEQRLPDLDAPVIVRPHEQIQDVQQKMIQRGAAMVLLCDHQERLMAVVTLHDLLRAQLSYGKMHGDRGV